VPLRVTIETSIEPGKDGGPECRADLGSEYRRRNVWTVAVDPHGELADTVVQQGEVPDVVRLVANGRRSEDRDGSEFLSDLSQLPLELCGRIFLADNFGVLAVAGQRVVPGRLLHRRRLAGIPRGPVKLPVLAEEQCDEDRADDGNDAENRTEGCRNRNGYGAARRSR
jgi:hypothetical protein